MALIQTPTSAVDELVNITSPPSIAAQNAARDRASQLADLKKMTVEVAEEGATFSAPVNRSGQELCKIAAHELHFVVGLTYIRRP